MPLLVYSSADFPFQPFTKILSADINQCYSDIRTLLNTTGLDSVNVQTHGLTRDRLAGGTANALLVNDASGYASELALGSANYIVRVNSAGTAFTTGFSSPTIQTFTITGTTTGYVFTVTSANATVGATYTNNGNTYTVLATIAAATELFCSQAAAPQASGTLTKSAGTGDATITFSAAVAQATYTKPAAALWLRVKIIAGGGGGYSSGRAATVAGSNGTPSYFGAPPIKVLPGLGATGISGGVNTSTANSLGGFSGTVVRGAAGCSGSVSGVTASGATSYTGGNGGGSLFGGGGAGTESTGSAAICRGSGGGGAGFTGDGTNSYTTGGGGGAGSYIEAVISSPAATYTYAIGTGGAGGTLGTGGFAAGAGLGGYLEVTEYYQ